MTNHQPPAEDKYDCVYMCKKTNKWLVFFRHEKKRYYIGRFEDFIQAKQVRNEVVEKTRDINQDTIAIIEELKEQYKCKKQRYVDNTHVERIASKTINKNNSSGVRGVSWDRSSGKWKATIGFKGVNYHLGKFDTLEDAKKVRLDAEDRYYVPFLKNME